MNEDCECGITKEGLIYICPKHYGMMMEDSSIDYGLITNGK